MADFTQVDEITKAYIRRSPIYREWLLGFRQKLLNPYDDELREWQQRECL